jgi:hypothetical protein
LGDAHEDFKPSDDEDDCRHEEGRNLVEAAVGWFIDALRGRIEFTATYRGTDFSRRATCATPPTAPSAGLASFLTPARLRIWEPTRRVRHRPGWT